jgi:hypothetical protein
VVTTNDKIAEVGRIEVPAPTTSAPVSSAASAEAGPPDMAPTVTAANQTWADRVSYLIFLKNKLLNIILSKRIGINYRS